MATLTTLLRRTALRVHCGLPVRRFLPSVINFLVTGLAGLGSHILGHVGRGRRRSGRRCGGGLNSLTGSRRTSLAGSKDDDAEKEDQQKKSIDYKTRFRWYTSLCWYTHPTLAICHDVHLVLFVVTLVKQSARVARGYYFIQSCRASVQNCSTFEAWLQQRPEIGRRFSGTTECSFRALRQLHT